jgi:short-subunit dehydrogenase
MPLPKPSPQTTALVTGASSGIGTEIARGLARRGYGVTLVARRADRLAELATELAKAHDIRAEALDADLADPDARARLPGRVAELGLQVDVLVNNAGVVYVGDFIAGDAADQHQMVAVNVDAVVDLTSAYAAEMAARGNGGILIVSSTSALQPTPKTAVYGATKAFVSSFGSAIHKELKRKGVHVTTLLPGPVETEVARHNAGIHPAGTMPRPFWRSPEETAEAGVKGLVANRRVVMVGPNRFMPVVAKLTPARLSNALADRMTKTG